MKARTEDQRTAMEEALEMIAKGRPQDAAKTLSAALEAPTSDVSERDAALAEAVRALTSSKDAAVELGLTARAEVLLHARDVVRALQSAPAQVVSAAKILEVLARRITYATTEGHGWVAKELRAVAVDLGIDCECSRALGHPDEPDCHRLDLDAAPAKPLPPTACGKPVDGALCRRWDAHDGVCDPEGSR